MKESELESLSGLLAESMYWIKYKGVGDNGSSDKIFLKGGHGFTIEFKTAIGTRSDVQDNERKRLKKRKIPHYLVRTLQQFREALLLEEAKFSDEMKVYFYGEQKQ